MDAAHFSHLVVLVAWAIVVLVEGVLELRARARGVDERRRVAVLHYWIDIGIEIPLLIAVVATGAVLIVRVWPPTTLLAAKIALGLLAVGLNGYCAVHVVLRRRRIDDPAALVHHGRRVLLGGLGIPPALAATYIGAGLIGWIR